MTSYTVNTGLQTPRTRLTAEPKGRAAEAGRAAVGGGGAEIVSRQEGRLSNKNGAHGTVIRIVLGFCCCCWLFVFVFFTKERSKTQKGK